MSIKIFNKIIKKSTPKTITGIVSGLDSEQRKHVRKLVAKMRGEKLELLQIIERFEKPEFASMLYMSEGTLNRIQKGLTCLSLQAATQVCMTMLTSGIFVPLNWLLSNNDQLKLRLLDKTIQNFNETDVVTTYKNIYPNSLILLLNEEISPYFPKASFLIGQIIKDFQELKNTLCLCSINGEKPFVRFITYVQNQLALVKVNELVSQTPEMISINNTIKVAPLKCFIL